MRKRFSLSSSFNSRWRKSDDFPTSSSFSQSGNRGDSRPADTVVHGCLHHRASVTFPRNQQDTAHTQNHGNSALSYLASRLPPLPPLLQQIFAAFINYSGQGPQSSACSSNPRLICFGQIHTIGMPHIPRGFLRTPLRGQPGALRREWEIEAMKQ